MHGKDAGQVNSPDPALASTAQLLSECVHEYGVEPIPARVWRGWPREKIHRPHMDRLFVNVLAAETEYGTNVFISVSEVMVSNVVLPHFYQYGTDNYMGELYSSNSSNLRGPDESSPLLGPDFYTGLPSFRPAFTVEGLPNAFNIIENAPETAPVIGGVHNTLAWDSDVFGATIGADGKDIIYDEMWQSMQVATARLTRREE